MFHLKKCINNILSFAFYYFLLANVQVKKFPIHKRVPCYFRSFLKCYCAISTSRKKSQWLFNLDINYQYTAQSQPLTLQFVKICLKKLEIKVYTVENSKGFFSEVLHILHRKGCLTTRTIEHVYQFYRKILTLQLKKVTACSNF